MNAARVAGMAGDFSAARALIERAIGWPNSASPSEHARISIRGGQSGRKIIVSMRPYLDFSRQLAFL
jgi:hypothetical protein